MQRDEIADISRGIGILLVIAGHVPFYAFQENLIYFFHMPLFFFLSGITRNKQAWQYSFRSGSYLIANYIIYGLFFSIIGWLYFEENLFKNLQRMASFMPSQIWEITGFGVYWFILALAILKLCCASKFIYKSWPIGLLLFLMMPFLEEGLGSSRGFIIIGPALLGLFFYQTGRFYEPVLMFIRQKKWIAILASSILYFGLASYSIVALGGWQQKLVNLAHLQIFNPFVVVLLSLSGILLVLASSFLFTSVSTFRNVLSFYGRYSFILFTTHLFFIQILNTVLPQFWWEQHIMLTRVLVLVLTLIACTLLALIADKLPKRKTTLKKLLLMQ